MGEEALFCSVPLVKKTVDVQISVRENDGEDTIQSIPQIVRDDGGNLLGALGQINWGIRRKRKYRANAGKVMDDLRAFNFSQSLVDDYETTIEIPESICQQVYDLLAKEDCVLKGPNAVVWATQFEKWWSERTMQKTQE